MISEENIDWLRFRSRIVAHTDPKTAHTLRKIANECESTNKSARQTESFIKGLAGNMQAFVKTEFDE